MYGELWDVGRRVGVTWSNLPAWDRKIFVLDDYDDDDDYYYYFFNRKLFSCIILMLMKKHV